MPDEHRQEVRKRVFLKGRIRFNNGASSMDCLVRDLSSSGARIALSETSSLPEIFDLHIPQKDRTYRATLRWRREDGIGVTFEEEGGRTAGPEAGAEVSIAILQHRVGELEAENAALRRLLTDMAQAGAPTAA